MPSQSYNEALNSVEQTLTKLKGCTEDEKSRLRGELAGLRTMHEKLTSGRVEIVIFGEISTGKSALINALVGSKVSEVDVRGGWTKEVWHVAWNGAGYSIPGLGESQVVLIDTPGINEVGGGPRGEMARDVAQRADLILFVTDSDLNETEYTALVELTTFHKPILLILNKVDLYSREQRSRLIEVLNERLRDILPPDQIVTASADPREKEYIIQAADGSERSEWRKPLADVSEVKARILQLLEKEGLALIALNAALYASDQSDKVAALRVQLRNSRAEKIIWGVAGMKAVAVGFNPIPVADVLGGLAFDGLMIVYLAEIYNLQMSTKHAQELAKAIGAAAGGITLSVAATHGVTWFFKTLTPLWGTLMTALPQGTAAGYGTYIVGKAAKYYFENGSSWGSEGPKTVVTRIIDSIDKDSIMQQFKSEIGKKLLVNRHAKK
ncbi:GTPase Era [Anatilimnocola aggregata]|uniref:GTPase Era n=1 Tax=Anatilimnocola aggregata TaxID=2528021 RepID=A0A517YAQ4_9BACT|nr:GTP-binding protein [Anatilimnocola aggregata]QDU27310.1 GTPase Era [Anatilimnocola aggregata]